MNKELFELIEKYVNEPNEDILNELFISFEKLVRERINGAKNEDEIEERACTIIEDIGFNDKFDFYLYRNHEVYNIISLVYDELFKNFKKNDELKEGYATTVFFTVFFLISLLRVFIDIYTNQNRIDEIANKYPNIDFSKLDSPIYLYRNNNEVEKLIIDLSDGLFPNKEGLETEKTTKVTEIFNLNEMEIERPNIEVLDFSNNNDNDIVFPKDKAMNITSGVFNKYSDIHNDIYSEGETFIDYRNQNEKSKNNVEAYAIMTMNFDDCEQQLELSPIDYKNFSILSNYQLTTGNKLSLYECTKKLLGKERVTSRDTKKIENYLKFNSSIWTKYSNKDEAKQHKNIPYISYEGHLLNLHFTCEEKNGHDVKYVILEPCYLGNGKLYNTQPAFLISLLKKQIYSVPKSLVHNPFNNSISMTKKSITLSLYIQELIYTAKYKAKKNKEKVFKYNLNSIYQKNGIFMKKQNNKYGYLTKDSLRKAKREAFNTIKTQLETYKANGVIENFSLDSKNMILYV